MKQALLFLLYFYGIHAFCLLKHLSISEKNWKRMIDVHFEENSVLIAELVGKKSDEEIQRILDGRNLGFANWRKAIHGV